MATCARTLPPPLELASSSSSGLLLFMGGYVFEVLSSIECIGPHFVSNRYIECTNRWTGKIILKAEETMSEFNRITFDPQVMGGRACFRGMRITVSLVLNLIANGMGKEEILVEYPDLEGEDISQALRYAAWLADEHVQLLNVA